MQPLEHAQLASNIVETTVEVFQTMLGEEVLPGQPVLDQSGWGPSLQVQAMVGVAGCCSGTGILACTALSARKIASSLLMCECAGLDDDVLDAVAEMGNMIIGNLKNRLELTLGNLAMSIPTVIVGRNFTSRTLGKHSWTMVPFQWGEETLEVRLCLVSENSKRETPRPGYQLAPTIQI